MTDKRISWEKYFMKIAFEVATRSTCDRKSVGAVLVRNKAILSTGYNGSIKGLPHCDDIGHLIENDHCVRTVHAEANSIAQAAKNGVNCNNAEIYVTSSPCWNCFRLLANAGIKKIYYHTAYKDERIFSYAKQAKIYLERVEI